MLVPEADGGGSLSEHGLLDLVLVAEEMGRLVSPGPLVPVNVVASRARPSRLRRAAGGRAARAAGRRGRGHPGRSGLECASGSCIEPRSREAGGRAESGAEEGWVLK